MQSSKHKSNSVVRASNDATILQTPTCILGCSRGDAC
jgi:hypothetical protein